MRALPMSPVARQMLDRVPMALLTAGLLVLYLGMPYRSVDSDAATFGIMGNDLLRYHHLPTLAIGQDYLFSLTPYVYALLRLLLPRLSAPVLYALAGSVLSLGGLWLIYESLLRVQRREGQPTLGSGAVFCLLVAASPTFVFELSVNSGLEVAVFLLGVTLFAASSCGPGARAWRTYGVLGAAISFAAYSRPQIAMYGCVALIPLLRREQRFKSSLVGLGAGLFVGYAPMLFHKCRLLIGHPWPFTHHLQMAVGTGDQVSRSLGMLAHVIVPGTFSIRTDYPIYSAFAWVFMLVALGLAVVAVRRRPVNAWDAGWAYGSLLVLILMLLNPWLSYASAQRRYCIQVVLAAAWFAARYSHRRFLLRHAFLGVAAILCALSLPMWRDSLASKWQDEQNARKTVNELVPVLARHGGVFLTDYWDAYRLSFLADGALTVEAFPWDLVRTYGWVTAEQLRARTAWLIKSGYTGAARDHLRESCGDDILKKLKTTNINVRFFGRDCELWELPDPEAAVHMMEHHHPDYFRTPYPPGSGRLTPRLASPLNSLSEPGIDSEPGVNTDHLR